MSAMSNALTRTVWNAIGGNENVVDAVSFVGAGGLPSAYPVTDFASAAIATAALSILELLGKRSGRPLSATVDRRLSSFWFGSSIRPVGWRLPPPWDPIAGDYRTRDGWIRLHTNALHHRAAAERVLGTHADKDAMARTIEETPTDWGGKHVIAGFGFEIRSLGAWKNLVEAGQGTPRALTMLQYPDVGLLAQIDEFLHSASIPFNTVKTTSVMTSSEAQQLIAKCDGQMVVDTTSLTKPLIYMLVSQALSIRNEVWVLHTCAAEYYPPESDLAAAVELFERKEFPAAFKKLDELIAGEKGPYTSVPIGVQRQDPSQPSLMAAFVSLKHDRVVRLLEEAPVEVVAAISPVHSAGPDTNRSKAARYMAEYLVQRYTGEVYGVPSLAHDEAYELLVKLHRQYCLSDGYNFEIALTGTKMHTVAAGMFASIATPSSVYYSKPTRFDPERFTKGTGVTRLLHLKRIELVPSLPEQTLKEASPN